MKRFWKLMGNLLLIAVCAFLLWSLKGKPLNLAASYNRALRSHFIDDPPSTLTVWPQQGRVLAKREDTLYLYQQDSWGVPDESIQTFPIQDGMGFCMARNNELELPLEIFAYEESGKAASAKLWYAISYEGETLAEYERSGWKHGNLFEFQVNVEPSGYTEDGSPYYDGDTQEIVTDVYEVWQGYNIWANYELTITFYDEAGAVIGEIYESV